MQPASYSQLKFSVITFFQELQLHEQLEESQLSRRRWQPAKPAYTFASVCSVKVTVLSEH